CPPASRVTIASRTASGLPRITRSIAACNSSIFSAAVTARASESAVRKFLIAGLWPFYMYLAHMTTPALAAQCCPYFDFLAAVCGFLGITRRLIFILHYEIDEIEPR